MGHNVSSAVYTESEQQEVVGLPDGALLVTITIENDWESTLAIEDLDIYVGESTSDISGLVMPGYFTDEPLKVKWSIFTMPQTMWTLLTRQDSSHGISFSDDSTTDSWLRGNQRPFGFSLTENYTSAPVFLQGDGSATVFETFMPDLESVPTPIRTRSRWTQYFNCGRRRRS